MSLRSHAQGHPGRPADSVTYRRSFLSRAHHLIGQGYEQMRQHELSRMDEPAITGLLVQGVDDWLDSKEAPEWAERFSIQDEYHVNDVDLSGDPVMGKFRPRVDIRIIASGLRPRARLQIEAKRLRQPEGTSLKAYLGSEGFGSFLSCRYAKGQPWAGMLGYVQDGSTATWSDKIRDKMTEQAQALKVVPQTEILRPQSLEALLPDVYRSDHQRQDDSDIEVHHIFLHCN